MRGPGFRIPDYGDSEVPVMGVRRPDVRDSEFPIIDFGFRIPEAPPTQNHGTNPYLPIPQPGNILVHTLRADANR